LFYRFNVSCINKIKLHPETNLKLTDETGMAYWTFWNSFLVRWNQMKVVCYMKKLYKVGSAANQAVGVRTLKVESEFMLVTAQ